MQARPRSSLEIKVMGTVELGWLIPQFFGVLPSALRELTIIVACVEFVTGSKNNVRNQKISNVYNSFSQTR